MSWRHRAHALRDLLRGLDSAGVATFEQLLADLEGADVANEPANDVGKCAAQVATHALRLFESAAGVDRAAGVDGAAVLERAARFVARCCAADGVMLARRDVAPCLSLARAVPAAAAAARARLACAALAATAASARSTAVLTDDLFAMLLADAAGPDLCDASPALLQLTGAAAAKPATAAAAVLEALLVTCAWRANEVRALGGDRRRLVADAALRIADAAQDPTAVFNALAIVTAAGGDSFLLGVSPHVPKLVRWANAQLEAAAAAARAALAMRSPPGLAGGGPPGLAGGQETVPYHPAAPAPRRRLGPPSKSSTSSGSKPGGAVDEGRTLASLALIRALGVAAPKQMLAHWPALLQAAPPSPLVDLVATAGPARVRAAAASAVAELVRRPTAARVVALQAVANASLESDHQKAPDGRFAPLLLATVEGLYADVELRLRFEREPRVVAALADVCCALSTNAPPFNARCVSALAASLFDVMTFTVQDTQLAAEEPRLDVLKALRKITAAADAGTAQATAMALRRKKAADGQGKGPSLPERLVRLTLPGASAVLRALALETLAAAWPAHAATLAESASSETTSRALDAALASPNEAVRVGGARLVDAMLRLAQVTDDDDAERAPGPECEWVSYALGGRDGAAAKVRAACADPDAKVRTAACRCAASFAAMNASATAATDAATGDSQGPLPLWSLCAAPDDEEAAARDDAALSATLVRVSSDPDADASTAACRALGLVWSPPAVRRCAAHADAADAAAVAVAALTGRARHCSSAMFALSNVAKAMLEAPAPQLLARCKFHFLDALRGTYDQGTGETGRRSLAFLAASAPMTVTTAASALRLAAYVVNAYAGDADVAGGLARGLVLSCSRTLETADASESAASGAKLRRNACQTLGIIVESLCGDARDDALRALVAFLASTRHSDRKALAIAAVALHSNVSRIPRALVSTAVASVMAALRFVDADGPFPHGALDRGQTLARRAARTARTADEPRQRATLFAVLSALAASLLADADADEIRAAGLAPHLDFLYVWLARLPELHVDAAELSRQAATVLSNVAAALADHDVPYATLERFRTRATFLRRRSDEPHDEDDEL
ncbi:hypothetical protein M885DRAFT_526840 [Pelagophyceae sp. CCMP2097]|nr:hypothetical protein M885DRAFT_526840 [Pelagophyceae sp. CCMP2097]